MSLYITTLERYILESINKSNNSILQIQDDTKLDIKLISTVLKNLLQDKVIIQVKGEYCLHESITSNKVSDLKNKDHAVIELTEIVKINIKHSLLNQKDNKFNYKKVFLDSDELKILRTLMFSIESFLTSRTIKKGPTSQEQIIFWGNNSYLNTVSNFINN